MNDDCPIAGDDSSGSEDDPFGESGAADTGRAPSSSASQPDTPSRLPFPWERLLYAVGFAIVAWCVFWVVIVLAVVQFVLMLVQSITATVTGHPSDELKLFCRRMIQYLLELLAYITFVRETPPFPFSPFPAVPQTKGEA